MYSVLQKQINRETLHLVGYRLQILFVIGYAMGRHCCVCCFVQ